MFSLLKGLCYFQQCFHNVIKAKWIISNLNSWLEISFIRVIVTEYKTFTLFFFLFLTLLLTELLTFQMSPEAYIWLRDELSLCCASLSLQLGGLREGGLPRQPVPAGGGRVPRLEGVGRLRFRAALRQSDQSGASQQSLCLSCLKVKVGCLLLGADGNDDVASIASFPEPTDIFCAVWSSLSAKSTQILLNLRCCFDIACYFPAVLSSQLCKVLCRKVQHIY